jgi:hypothetical protein
MPVPDVNARPLFICVVQFTTDARTFPDGFAVGDGGRHPRSALYHEEGDEGEEGDDHRDQRPADKAVEGTRVNSAVADPNRSVPPPDVGVPGHW